MPQPRETIPFLRSFDVGCERLQFAARSLYQFVVRVFFSSFLDAIPFKIPDNFIELRWCFCLLNTRPRLAIIDLLYFCFDAVDGFFQYPNESPDAIGDFYCSCSVRTSQLNNLLGETRESEDLLMSTYPNLIHNCPQHWYHHPNTSNRYVILCFV